MDAVKGGKPNSNQKTKNKSYWYRKSCYQAIPETIKKENAPYLGCVDALDLDVCLEVMVTASGEHFDGEGSGSVLNDCCL